MKNTKIVSSVAATISVAVFMVGIAPDASASVLFSDTFESYTVGNPPTNPGDGDPSNWTFSPSLTAVTALGFSPGGTAPNQKVLDVSKTNVGGYTSFGRMFERQEADTTDLVRLTFALQVNLIENSSYVFKLTDGAGAFDGPISLRIANGNVGVESREDGAGQGNYLTTWNPQGGPLQVGDWYRFDVTANLVAQTYGVSVLNLTTGGQSGSVQGLYFMTNTSAVDGLLIRSMGIDEGQDVAIDWNLNDVQVEAIPEPTTVAMLLGALGLFVWKRASSRKKKQALI